MGTTDSSHRHPYGARPSIQTASDIFRESQFPPQQSYEWLRDDLKAYVIGASATDLESMLEMISLVDKFPIDPIELVVTSP